MRKVNDVDIWTWLMTRNERDGRRVHKQVATNDADLDTVLALHGYLRESADAPAFYPYTANRILEWPDEGTSVAAALDARRMADGVLAMNSETDWDLVSILKGRPVPA